jgi:NAD(P)-dependent dehydrogenase (short-subunit alcohol dehydrogenase family)
MGLSLVTGANRGIGLAICTQLHDRGDQVVAVCRTPSPELSALGVEIIDGIDVSDDASIQTLPARIDNRPIDVLVNNAGRLRRDGLTQPDDDEVLAQFVVNAMGPLRVTRALLPLLSSGSKIAHITSRMGSVADNTSGGMYGYRMSKAALNAAAKSMTVDLGPKGIMVAVLHPGFVRTGMTGGNGLVDAPESAAGLIARIDGLTMENSGTFWHMNGEVLPW